ncbi:OTU domain-containing 6B [Brachionus plicatilis]|uniref:OTU domain-containing 6B n=1 Tax=Brachionus plicatilis TaxID=10195 RepID=A0A3M7QAZ6_BRAPC|nr:OTU domain-containing 6B [Brachionus plicatilis]
MSNRNDERVLNAILNPNTPFEDSEPKSTTESKYEANSAIDEAKSLEIEGVKAAQAGDLKKSIETFGKAIEIAPHWASSYNNRAQALRLSGDTDRNSETLESLTNRHRKEKKELQTKLQSLKKSVTKGDKKKKKEIDAEIEKLEREFEERCTLEIKNINQSTKQCDEKFNEQKLSGSTDIKAEKISKSQKRREKKEKSEHEREKAISLQEIENQKGPAAIELKKIKEKLLKKNLKVKEVISDGNCMYYAISDQIKTQLSVNKTFQELRDLTCDYMLQNTDDFQPYLTNDDGDFLGIEEYREYCHNIRNTPVWGGQLELKALSDVLKVSIEVVQGEGSNIVIGEDQKNRLVIAYHRHMLGSGEHYNSTEPKIFSLFTIEAWKDLEKAINLSKEFNDQKVLALALTQKGTILRLKGRDDEAIDCFKVASSCGNSFAKQQVVSMNPYAALCNQMLSDVFEKIKKGESY